MEFQELSLKDAFLITLPKFDDERGTFVKTFNAALFAAGADIAFDLQESYFSLSAKDVIRGMHFQMPPHEHAKIVFCPQGAILDVILDLRKDSPSYGQYEARVLSAENHQAYYIPPGFAHGFKSLDEGAMTFYLVSSGYHKASDTGILWNSFGFDWECQAPVLSPRDKSFVAFEDFQSPF
ncbi:MAG TPA: dTDP-4-dehydrorhamnose 3,5-epimerase family protein [Edaphocola sp.]|nr:dTDP-4-dehydrorhamnose 3,5-epimerase family protein [Edaphocola sp.]